VRLTNPIETLPFTGGGGKRNEETRKKGRVDGKRNLLLGGTGEGEEDQPKREPHAEETSKRLALKAPSA